MNRTDGTEAGLSEKETLMLARLSERALDGGALADTDELDLDDCREALEMLTLPSDHTLERLEVWLGADYWLAERRARQLRSVLEACANVAICADQAQAAPVMRTLQRLAYRLGGLVESRSPLARRDERDGSRLLLEALQRRIDAVAASSPGVGLLLVHCAAIDRIDALHGLRAGENFSKAIVTNLREHVLRPSDTVEPISRDEFACVLHPVPSEGVAILAAQKILRVLDSTVDLGDFAAAAEPNIGIALFPEHARDTDELLQHAKAALREARGGRERIATYRPDARATQFDESRYAARLRHAIHNNELELHYQPQVNFRDRSIVGAEALLRWKDPQLGAVPPNIAVSVAESAGLINDLTLWVLGAAIQQCATFRALKPDLTVSVNISPSNLQEPDLAAYVGRSLRTWNLAGKGLVLEITETAILNDQKAAIEALDSLKRLGVGVAIDDFGTGYSSMYYLAQMPLDELKIDIMFVRQMLELPTHAKIVRSLIELAHNLELSVVAEGVENEAIWSALDPLGCDRAQGWYIGKPVAAADFTQRLR